jgi:hypothetical protein
MIYYKTFFKCHNVPQYGNNVILKREKIKLFGNSEYMNTTTYVITVTLVGSSTFNVTKAFKIALSLCYWAHRI